MKNIINCLSLSPRLMKKWRRSRRCTFEEKPLAPNGAHGDDSNLPHRRDCLRFIGEFRPGSRSANLAVGEHVEPQDNADRRWHLSVITTCRRDGLVFFFLSVCVWPVFPPEIPPAFSRLAVTVTNVSRAGTCCRLKC